MSDLSATGDSSEVTKESNERGPVTMLPDERGPAVLCHASTIIPLWALLANALFLFFYRESSRAVCFHARQSIHFHLLLLIVSVPMLLLLPFEKLLLLVGAPANIVSYLPILAQSVLLVLYSLYSACCVVGMLQASRGRVFVYPFVKLDPATIREESAMRGFLP